MRDSEHQGDVGQGSGGHEGSGLRRGSAEGGEEETEGRGEVGGSPLLKAILSNFRDPCLDKMLERLDSVLTESTSYSRNSAMMRHQVWRVSQSIRRVGRGAQGRTGLVSYVGDRKIILVRFVRATFCFEDVLT